MLIESSIDWQAQMQAVGRYLMPEVILTLMACALLVLDVVTPQSKKRWIGYVSIGGVIASGFSLFWMWYTLRPATQFFAFSDMFVIDNLAIAFKAIFLVAAALSIAISIKYLDVEEDQHGEYYALVLFSTVGMMVIASGSDLLSLYIGMELMALSVYVLVGYMKRDRRSNEASMKYFLMGAFSSGILLYGISLFYGVTGSTNLVKIANALGGEAAKSDLLIVVATILIAAGLCFKIAAVPFHMWAPDAYEGAPTSVTAFMSVGVKAGSYALFARIFLSGLYPLYDNWVILLGIIAAITMTWGNVGAVTQTNIKRLMAYSSIAHAGYILLGLIAGNEWGYWGIVVYLMAYTFMNLGAFGVIIALRRKGVMGDQLDDLNGLIKTQPWLAVLMLVFMLSLAGIPPTAGFAGKFLLFGGLIKRAATDATANPGRAWWLGALAVVAVLNTAVSLYYYFNFVKAMFVSETTEKAPLSLSYGLKIALGVSLVLTLFIGVYPTPFINLASSAASSFAGLLK